MLRNAQQDVVDVFVNICGTFGGREYTSLAIWCWFGSIVDVASLASVRKGITRATHFWCHECHDHVKCEHRRVIGPLAHGGMCELVRLNSLCFRHGSQLVRAEMYLIQSKRALCGTGACGCTPFDPVLFDQVERIMVWRTHRRTCTCFICDEGLRCKRWYR